MAAFDIDSFIQSARDAASRDNAAAAMQQFMEATFANAAAIAHNIPDYADDEVMFFEDQSVSIWYCRFDAGLHVPPHEHRMNAYIGVFRGQEDNLFYQRSGDVLKHINTRTARCGDVLALGRESIHSVRNDGDNPSHGLHVYLGPLSIVERDLFDIDSGEAMQFTEESYNRLKSFAD